MFYTFLSKIRVHPNFQSHILYRDLYPRRGLRSPSSRRHRPRRNTVLCVTEKPRASTSRSFFLTSEGGECGEVNSFTYRISSGLEPREQHPKAMWRESSGSRRYESPSSLSRKRSRWIRSI